MSDLTWLVLIGENAKIQTSLLSSLNSLSLKPNSLFIVAYAVLVLLTKRSLPLAAFFMSVLLFELSLFDEVKEYQLYLMTFVVYSCVITQHYMLFKQKIACGILLILSLLFAYDSLFYGVGGYYGEYKTLVWRNIPNLSVCAHILFITSFIDARRINNNIRLFFTSVVHISRNSVNFVLM